MDDLKTMTDEELAERFATYIDDLEKWHQMRFDGKSQKEMKAFYYLIKSRMQKDFDDLHADAAAFSERSYCYRIYRFFIMEAANRFNNTPEITVDDLYSNIFDACEDLIEKFPYEFFKGYFSEGRME